jgi:hypothetical protein
MRKQKYIHNSILSLGMFKISRRYAHFIYGIVQAGITSGIAALIASWPNPSSVALLANWLRSWIIAWGMMVPVVILIAPMIRRAVLVLTRDD